MLFVHFWAKMVHFKIEYLKKISGDYAQILKEHFRVVIMFQGGFSGAG
jgi:hypothetical protein